MSTLIVGDLHLGKGLNLGKPALGLGYNSRVVDQINLLNWLLKQAIDLNVDSFIFTGDIFEDVKPDYSLIDVFLKFLQECREECIEVHLIMGNHDLKRSGNQYNTVLHLFSQMNLPNVFIYKNIYTLIKPGVGFTLLPFRDRKSLNCDNSTQAIQLISEKLPYELVSIPADYDKILIGHLALEGSMWIGDEFDDLNNEIICPLSIFEGYDYVWMGHVHKPQVRSKKPYRAHIGSLDLSDFGETDHKKIVILYNPLNLQEKFKEIPVPTRPLFKLEINLPEGVDPTNFVLEELKKANNLRNGILKLEIKLGDSLNHCEKEKIEEWLYQEAKIFHLAVFTESHSKMVVSEVNKYEVDNTVEPKTACKLYAEKILPSKINTTYDTEEIKSLYLEESYRIIEAFQTSIKK